MSFSVDTSQRAELTALEQGEVIARRKTIYETLHPETKHGAVGRGGKSGHNGHSSAPRFSTETATKTGISEQAIYETLHPETKHGAVGRGGKSRHNGDYSAPRFSEDTEKQSGLAERTVQRSAQIGSMPAEVRDAVQEPRGDAGIEDQRPA